MGNDLYSNEKFMQRYNKYNAEFIEKMPLFYVQDIKFPLYTSGAMIVDSTGRRVKIAGGNWSGGHLCRQCVDGLQCRPLIQMARQIKTLFNMNCVRLTYSLQLFFDNKVVPEKYLTANPELIGKTAIQIFDFTVKTLTDAGLMVLLNNHTSSSMWCCSNDDGDGLWWSYKYPENLFFQCAEQFARRYKDNPLVIGMDLRNQLRKANGLEATWGDNNALTDWHRAATICGDRVLAIAPHWLIVVGGLNFQLDLTGILDKTIVFKVPNKLVYSGHLYSFSWPPSWANFSYQSFKKKLFNSQFFVRALGYPFIMGEFGNNKRDTIWNYLIKYLSETDVDWIYWPLDGFKCDPNDPQQDQTYGIWTNDFKGVRNPDIFNDLQSISISRNILKQKNKKQKEQKKHQPNLRREEPKIQQKKLNKSSPNAQVKTQLKKQVKVKAKLPQDIQKISQENIEQKVQPKVKEEYSLANEYVKQTKEPIKQQGKILAASQIQQKLVETIERLNSQKQQQIPSQGPIYIHKALQASTPEHQNLPQNIPRYHSQEISIESILENVSVHQKNLKQQQGSNFRAANQYKGNVEMQKETKPKNYPRTKIFQSYSFN